RQPGLAPGAETASETGDPREALALQRRGGFRRALAAVVVDDQRPFLLLRQIAAAFVDAVERQMPCAEDMARAVLGRIAHVEHQPLLAVDELDRARAGYVQTARQSPH